MRIIVLGLILALLAIIVKHIITRNESDEGKAVLAKHSTKIATVVGWIIIASAVIGFIYFVFANN